MLYILKNQSTIAILETFIIILLSVYWLDEIYSFYILCAQDRVNYMHKTPVRSYWWQTAMHFNCFIHYNKSVTFESKL